MAAKIASSREDRILDGVIMACMLIVLFLTLYPFYYSLILSFNEGQDSTLGGIYFFPRKFTLENYRLFFSDARWLRAFAVTVLRTVLGTAFTVLTTALFSYTLSFRKLVFRKLYINLVIVAMYFSGGLIPYYVTLRSVGLINTFWVYILPGGVNLFFVLIAITFFQSISEALHEAATLDGASEIQTFARVILPISLPLMATMSIFVGVGHWNAWFDSAFLVQNKALRTMGYLLMEVINQNVYNSSISATTASMITQSAATPLSTQVTAMIIAVAPIMLIYPFFQKYFITGLTIGSVKE